MVPEIHRAMLPFTRAGLAERIAEKLAECEVAARSEFHTRGRIPSFAIDELLPPETALKIYAAFPGAADMVLKRTLGQLKFVGYELGRYDPLIEEVIYAFQDARIVRRMEAITGLSGLLPDEHLYAGGISLMQKGHHLNPHLDNSHDKDQKLYRVLNLLYYITPDWDEENGGNLELWDGGPGELQRTLPSKFNRLVVMQTDEQSWHSVSEVRKNRNRCCVSNYYFAEQPAGADAAYHVTSFRGWPRQKALDAVMRLDNGLRHLVRRTLGERFFKNPHVYKK